ncbi:MAG: CsgG/HfaB family protein [Candidatus Neomarinimicrobiota bacterium]
MTKSSFSAANWLIAILLICLPHSARAQEKPTLAVLDLEGRGISALEATTLTDRLRSELVKTGMVTVVERGQMDRILTEQDFQLTGCISDECAVEVGQLLGVTQMVAGAIGRLGQAYMLDIRVIDVQTGAIMVTMTRDYRGEIEGLIEEIESLARDIVGQPQSDEILVAEGDEVPGTELEKKVQPKKKSRWLLYGAGIVIGGGVAYILMGGEEAPLPDITLPPELPQVP